MIPTPWRWHVKEPCLGVVVHDQGTFAHLIGQEAPQFARFGLEKVLKLKAKKIIYCFFRIYSYIYIYTHVYIYIYTYQTYARKLTQTMASREKLWGHALMLCLQLFTPRYLEFLGVSQHNTRKKKSHPQKTTIK